MAGAMVDRRGGEGRREQGWRQRWAESPGPGGGVEGQQRSPERLQRWGRNGGGE